jgi:AcrR family transcriptional regulator
VVSECSLTYGGQMGTSEVVRRPGRAAPLPPDARRQAIIDAVLPLLREHGRAVTTRMIAERAAIAEGTIFRVFDSKEHLVDAALAQAFAPGPFLEGIAGIDPALPLRERLLAFVTVLQGRFVEIFSLMHAMGLVAPPDHLHASDEAGSWRARASEASVDLVAPDAHALRVTPEELVRYLRLLTFAGSHAEIADHKLMTPAEIVDLVLVGALATPGPEGTSCCCGS